MSRVKKILLLGKTGQLGQALYHYLIPRAQVLALGRSDEGGDLTKLNALTNTVQDYKPDIIINAAAYTLVDKAEEETALAYEINTAAVATLAELAQKQRSWLIHYSTDYVFDGSGERPWQETDVTQPINIYGETKRAGELAIESCCEQFIIFRTSWIYSRSGHNFLKTILERIQKQAKLSVVNDQIGSPTGVDLITHITWQVLNKMTSEHTGIYHLAAQGYTSWYDFAKMIIAQAKQYQDLAIDELQPISSREYVASAKRPLNSRLDTRKLIETFNLNLPDWQIEAKRTIVAVLQENAS